MRCAWFAPRQWAGRHSRSRACKPECGQGRTKHSAGMQRLRAECHRKSSSANAMCPGVAPPPGRAAFSPAGMQAGGRAGPEETIHRDAAPRRMQQAVFIGGCDAPRPRPTDGWHPPPRACMPECGRNRKKPSAGMRPHAECRRTFSSADVMRPDRAPPMGRAAFSPAGVSAGVLAGATVDRAPSSQHASGTYPVYQERLLHGRSLFAGGCNALRRTPRFPRLPSPQPCCPASPRCGKLSLLTTRISVL